MARPKRAASQVDTTASDSPAKKGRRDESVIRRAAGRSKRASIPSEDPATLAKKHGKEFPITAAAGRPRRAPVKKEEAPASPPKTAKRAVKSKALEAATASESSTLPEASKASRASVANKQASKSAPRVSKLGKVKTLKVRRRSIVSAEVPVVNQRKKRGKEVFDRETPDDAEEEEEASGVSYWLLKAEPESRMEKGKDVKFSIDDLAACAEPEAWDGVRNLAARNNIRAMMKGDLAFFYHSNCKVPGIAGVMEIVREHSVDESAFKKDHPYYDEKSTRDKPKWLVVHVEFRHKFKKLVKLKDLQKFSQTGGVLQEMQTLKQSRLSVSKVSKKEWDFIHGLAEIE